MDLVAHIEGIKGLSVPAPRFGRTLTLALLPSSSPLSLSLPFVRSLGLRSWPQGVLRLLLLLGLREGTIQTSGNPSNTDSLTAKVAWTAGQNKLADDADKEFANLQRVTQPEPFGIDISLQTTAGRGRGRGSRALAEFLNASTARKFENTNPSRVFGSFSEFARSIVEINEKQ
ncbi:hypothetical protein H9Q74_010176 [Fusarium xylarioides]|nr:hypothetical protein H9Q71_008531 [Fusarium xylarioides]KAG5818208.1 hypothetical protein H9Q74_010176 [Fusarium xylarioides]